MQPATPIPFPDASVVPLTEALELSVVLLCLNERETVGICVQKAVAALEQANMPGEVIVADNGSADGSIELALAAGARVVPVSHRGYGNALRGGIQAPQGSYVLMADSDDSYDFGHLPRFVEQWRKGSDLVMGNRFVGGIREGARPVLHRHLGSPVLTAIGRLFLHSPSRDFHYGIGAFRKDSYDHIRSTGMEFASDMVVETSLPGMKVSEVSTSISPNGRSHPLHLRTWHDGWRHLRFLLMYGPRCLFLDPALASILVSLVACIWLMPGPRRMGAIWFGFQLLAFAVFTKIFAVSEGLLPEDPRLHWMFEYIQLETGMLLGGLYVLLGFCGSVLALFTWSRATFGAITSDNLLGLVMLSVFALILRPQIIFSSFFLSILGLCRR